MKLNQTNNFWSILFDANEYTCFGESATDTKVTSVEEGPGRNSEFFTINPLDGNVDRQPVESYHRADRPRRADCNVVAYRNFLIECDDETKSIEQQLESARSIELPYSTAVFSGGKSVHFIISLAAPLANIAEYKTIFERLKVVYPTLDRSCKNPSRFSRTPGVTRADKNVEQHLIEVRRRITLDELHTWLSKFPETETVVAKEARKKKRNLRPGMRIVLSQSTRAFLMCGSPNGTRHHRLFVSAIDFAASGVDYDLAKEELYKAWTMCVPDRSRDSEFENAVRDAYRAIELQEKVS